jgi:hypothetical protein
MWQFKTDELLNIFHLTFNDLCIDDVTILHKSIYYGHMNIFSYHDI